MFDNDNIKEFVMDFLDAAENLDAYEIPIFILAFGLLICLIFGIVALTVFVAIQCPIFAILALISFGIPSLAIWYSKHRKT